MYRTTQTSPSSISRDFITFGHEALAVHRAEERRATELNRNQIHNTLRATRPAPWARRWLGTLMIALGTGIAGKTTQVQLQEREATSPIQAAGRKLAPAR